MYIAVVYESIKEFEAIAVTCDSDSAFTGDRINYRRNDIVHEPCRPRICIILTDLAGVDKVTETGDLLTTVFTFRFHLVKYLS